MKSNINIPQTKKDYRISNALRQYASAQINERSNNIYSVPIPQAKKILIIILLKIIPPLEHHMTIIAFMNQK